MNKEEKLKQLKKELEKEKKRLNDIKEVSELKDKIYNLKAEQRAAKKKGSWIDWNKLSKWGGKARDWATDLSNKEETKKGNGDGLDFIFKAGEYSGIAQEGGKNDRKNKS